MTPRSCLPLIASLVAFAPVDTVHGQATRDTTARRIEPVVVTGTRVPATVGGAGAVVVRPDSLPIPTLPAPLLDQVLRQTPFVLVRQNSRGEVELSVRGSDSRQAAVLLDGLPLTLGWDHRTDASLIPTTGINQLTLVRGLSSLLTGPNALGGVISLSLNAAPVEGAGVPAAPRVNAGTGIDQYSAHVTTAAVTVPTAFSRGTLTVRAGGSHRQRDGFALSRNGAAGDGTTGGVADAGSLRNSALRTNTDLRESDAFAAVRFDATSGAYLGVTGTMYDAERGVAPEQHIEAPRFWRYPNTARKLGVLSAGTGVLGTPFGNGKIDASVGTYQGEVQIDAFTDRTYSELDTRELGDEQSTTARVTATHSLPGNGQLRVGGTHSSVRYLESLNAQDAGFATTRYRQSLSSFGGEVEFPVAARMLVSGGVVRDAAETPESGGREPLGTLSLIGWRLGTTIAMENSIRLHASASRRGRFPALRELYSGALNRFSPNPDLRPEQLTAFEAGATFAGDALAARGLTFQVIGFHHQLDDAVIRITQPDRLFRRINRDEIRSSGVELLGTWSPRALNGVSFTGDMMAQRVRVYDITLAAGEPNERRPEHQPEVRGSLNVGVPLPLQFQGSALARYTGKQFCVHPDLGEQVELGAQAVGDAAISRGWSLSTLGNRFLQSLRAVVAVDNITNRTVYDQCGLPQPGRTFRVGVELR